MGARDFEGLRVLVSAAGGGAGRVIARRFHAAGARVAACDIDGAGIRSLGAECPGMIAVEADAGEEAAVDAVYAAFRDKFGGLDVLVNNVGIAGPTSPAEDITLDQWNASLKANLTSHFLFARRAIPMMKAQKSGLIVNISSGSVKVGLPLRLPYTTTKGAVATMSTNLARELGPFGIRVNAILPGPIRGERIERVLRAKAEALGIPFEDHIAACLRYISMRTMVEPEDISAMIEFLASPGGARVSGQLIGVDGNIEWEE